MTQAEQAVLLWPMLALAARTQKILSYAAVEGYRHASASANFYKFYNPEIVLE